MARNYILGGMAATQLQAGKPYFKRIIRANGAGTGFDEAGAADGMAAFGPLRPDGFTVKIDDDNAMPANPGAIRKDGENGRGKDWGATGELLMIEFPTTMRNVQILLEEVWDSTGDMGAPEKQTNGSATRCKVMLSAPSQDVRFPQGVIANPATEGNYIEIQAGETATINSRQKVVFILIEKFASKDVLDGTGALTARAVNGEDTDAVSILITGVLDHEPKSGSSSSANEAVSRIIDADGTTERSLRQIWGNGDGIG